LRFKQGVIRDYPDLFGDPDAEPTYNLTSEGNFGRKWGWLSSVDHLAQGDVSKYDSVTKLPLHLCLTKLVFDAEKNDLERKAIERARMR